MSTARRSRIRQEREQSNLNGTRPINKLPNEILAEIFVLCSRLCVYANHTSPFRKRPYEDYACQVAIPAVCYRWRSVALETHQLWSRVALSDSVPWIRSALLLARSGSTALLDIDINMTEAFWDDLKTGTTEECAERARQALEFIISHGGAASRWQSVIISTDAFGPHRVVADFLRSTPLPELRYFELGFQGPSEFDQFDEFAFEDAMAIEPLPLFRDPPSRLRTLKVQGLPNPFLFGHFNQLHLPGLTCLKVDFVDFPPRLIDISTLLRVTSQLVVLHFTFEFTEPITMKPDPQMPKVHLRYLREFGLSYIKEGFWPMSFLMGFEAPNVDFLQIGVVECEAGSRELIGYLADRGDKSNPKPLFPSITRLKAWLAGGYSPTKLLKTLLRAHPQITVLEVPLAPLDALLVKPWLAPNLQRLGVLGSSGSELKKVVDARTTAMLPLRVVDVDAISGYRIRSVDRKYLSSKVEFRLVEYIGGPRVVNDVPSEGEDDSLFFCYQQLAE